MEFDEEMPYHKKKLISLSGISENDYRKMKRPRMSSY